MHQTANLRTPERFTAPVPMAAGVPERPLHVGDAFVPHEISLRRLTGARAIAQVVHLREHIDLSTHTVIDPGFEAHERLRDELGFVGAFHWRGRLIGTIRVVPMGHGLTLTETLLAQAADSVPPTRGAHDWEVGRLVLAPEYRTNYEVLRQCLWLSVTYLHEHAPVQALHASCSHALGRLYRRFGFSILVQDVLLAGTSKSYTLIRGEPARVIDALKPRAALN